MRRACWEKSTLPFQPSEMLPVLLRENRSLSHVRAIWVPPKIPGTKDIQDSDVIDILVTAQEHIAAFGAPCIQCSCRHRMALPGSNCEL